MARLLLCTIPAVGHVHPMLPLARALVARGHEVRWYTGSAFRARVEATGAGFEPMLTPLDPGEHQFEDLLPAVHGLTGVPGIKAALKYFFIHSSVGQVADLRRVQERWAPEATVADTSFLGAGYLHELGEGPVWAALSTLPLILSSRDTAPFGPGVPPLGGALGRARNAVLQKLATGVLMRDVTAHNDALRAGMGLPARPGLIFDSTLSPYLLLQAGVRALEYPRSDLPPQVHFVGPLRGPAGAAFEAPPWWAEVLEARVPVVHVTQGTVNTAAGRLLAPTMRALAQEEVLVVVTTGGADVSRLGPLPANVRAARFVPHDALLPHVAVMVTNGGFGGVQTALAHGVPLVVAGDTEDKPEVANRVAFAGAGVNLRTGTPAPSALRRAVRQVLADPRYRARARVVAAEIDRLDGTALSVGLVEELVRTGSPVLRTPAAPGLVGV